MGNCLDTCMGGADEAATGAKASNKNSNKTPTSAGGNNGNSNIAARPLQKRRSNGSFNASSATSPSIHGGIMREHSIDVYKKYSEMEVLGTGSMGHVSRVTLKEGGGGTVASGSGGAGSASCESRRHKIEYALKSIQLDRVSPSFVDELKNEIDILKSMDHPNIVRLYEVYYHKKQIFMILELCDGGDLYTRLPYSEKDAAYITGKLLSAITYMHEHGVVHRDLKFENIMFENRSPGAEIKVIDFGLSKKFTNNKIGVMHEGVGTLYSMAPQVLQGVYTSQADMWSCGVITYMLLSSHRPFYNKKRQIMIDRIMRCDYTFEKDYWRPVSLEAKDFISHLLVLDPRARFTAEKAQKHIWLSKAFRLSSRAPTAQMSELVAENLLVYKDTAQLKKIALNVIAYQSSTEEILQLRKAFGQFDTGNNGIISYDEFKAGIRDKCSLSDEETKHLFDSIDVNQNGHIMYTEFIAATLEAQGFVDEERIAEAFERLDIDNSGYISRQNMLDFLGGDAKMDDIIEMLRESDEDNDGQISYPEFMHMFRSSNPKNAINQMSTFESRDSDNELVGLDAKIPGGKHDETVEADSGSVGLDAKILRRNHDVVSVTVEEENGG